MSLSTYAELLDAVAAWSFNRSDLPAAALVTLGEARLNRDLRLRAMEQEAALAAEAGQRLIDLPEGFIAPVALWRVGPGGREPLGQGRAEMTVSDLPGLPRLWAVDGERLAFERPCVSAQAFVLRFCRRLSLSASQPVNWLLAYHPDAYLAAALVEAALWAQDDEQAARWELRYQACVSSVRQTETRNRRPPLRTETLVAET